MRGGQADAKRKVECGAEGFTVARGIAANEQSKALANTFTVHVFICGE